MNHTESAYIEIGRRYEKEIGRLYEKAQSVDTARAVAHKIRAMLSSEQGRDLADARELIERGRAEYRGSARA